MIYVNHPLDAAPPALDNLDSQLPPPEPRDKEDARPKLDQAQVNRQVRGIQQFLHEERERKAAKEKGEQAK